MRTPPSPVDVIAVFPELRPFGRTATRLHPRPGRVRAGDSHVGGPLLWPQGEPWPVCSEPHMGTTDVPLPQELITRLHELEKQREQPHVVVPGEMAVHREIARIVGPGYMARRTSGVEARGPTGGGGRSGAIGRRRRS